ncbi:MAG: hypothetical protein JWM57_694, partial [Phycisphaerales bacterium]|nr:hypothetical protein [Phycisphaerales bacterium]
MLAGYTWGTSRFNSGGRSCR